MPLPRYKAKRDASEKAIVETLEAMGVFVWRLDQPCDLLCIHKGKVFLIECKTPGQNEKRRQKSQEEIARLTDLHFISTAKEAEWLVKTIFREAA